jgi:hypothetical protein
MSLHQLVSTSFCSQLVPVREDAIIVDFYKCFDLQKEYIANSSYDKLVLDLRNVTSAMTGTITGTFFTGTRHGAEGCCCVRVVKCDRHVLCKI